jgi:hypothetical protein
MGRAVFIGGGLFYVQRKTVIILTFILKADPNE